MNGQFQGGQTLGYPQASPPQVSTLAEFNSEIAAAAKAVAELRDQARAIADSVFGVPLDPTTLTTTGSTAIYVSSGNTLANPGASAPKASAVRSSIADLHSAIGGLRTAIERLTCI